MKRFFKYCKTLILVPFIGMMSCNKDDGLLKDKIQTTLSIPEISDVGLYSATIRGSLSYDGEEIKSRGLGLVWSTNSQPEPSDSIQQSWSIDSNLMTYLGNPFPISEDMQNLELNTEYYVRSYFVHKDLSLVYGPEISFKTLSGDAWHKHVESQYPGDLTQSPTGFVINDIFYVGLGFSDNSTAAQLEWMAYDLNEKKWTKKMSIPSSVGINAVSFSIEDKGYILSEISASLWEYDTANDRWTMKTDFPNANLGINLPLSIALNGKGYIGGNNGKELWEFDPSDASEGIDEHGNPMGRWTQKASHEGGMIFQPHGFVINDDIYMYNEYVLRSNEGEFIGFEKEFWAYNPLEDLWTKKKNFPGEMSQLKEVAFSIDGLGYLGGGRHPEFWSYTPETDEWLQKNNAPTLDSNISFSTKSRGYFFSDLGTILEYVP